MIRRRQPLNLDDNDNNQHNQDMIQLSTGQDMANRPVSRYLLEHGLTLQVSYAMLDHDFAMHQHNFSELVLITGGSAVHVIDGLDYPIRRGDVYVLHGDTAHGFCKTDQLELFNVMYDPAVLSVCRPDFKTMPGFQALFVLEPLYRRQHQFRHHLRLRPDQLSLPIDLLQAMRTEGDQQREGGEQAMLAYFQAMIAWLCRIYTLNTEGEAGRLFPLARAFARIEQDYLVPMSVREIAASIPMSTRHFMRIFRATYQTTPQAYIIRLRLEHARHRMQAGETSITAIAGKSGFSDSNYFSRQFRQHYGLSPRAYLRVLQSGPAGR